MLFPLQVAIFGCGSMGEIHARCLSQIEGVRLRATLLLLKAVESLKTGTAQSLSC
jgi:hypothetical protein